MTTIKPRKYSIDQMIEIIATLKIDDKVKLWQWLEKDIKQSQSPWVKTAGIFEEDPHFNEVQQFISDYRQEIDQIEE
jgi:hypothetical protein